MGFDFKNPVKVCANEGILVSILRFYAEVPERCNRCET